MLSERQLQILSLYAVGLTHEKIGAELFISPLTVMNKLKQIREELGARNSTHAVTIAVARGLLCVDHRREIAYIPAPLDTEPVIDDDWQLTDSCDVSSVGS